MTQTLTKRTLAAGTTLHYHGYPVECLTDIDVATNDETWREIDAFAERNAQQPDEVGGGANQSDR